MDDQDVMKIIDKFLDDTTRASRGEDVNPFATFHEDITWTMTGNTPISRTYRGVADMVENIGPKLASQFKTGTGFGMWPLEYIIEGNRAVVVARSRGQGVNEAPYHNSYFLLFEVRHGKIYRVVESYDGSHVMMTAFDTHLEEGRQPLRKRIRYA